MNVCQSMTNCYDTRRLCVCELASYLVRVIALQIWEGEGSFRFRKSRNPHNKNHVFSQRFLPQRTVLIVWLFLYLKHG